MRSLTSLLFFGIFKSTVYSTVVLSLCAWIIQSSRYFNVLNSNNIPIRKFIRFISFLSVDIVSIVLPIALAISVAFVLYRFVKSNQLIALQSVGGSPHHTLKAISIAVGVVVGYLYASNLYLSPAAWINFRNLEFSIKNNVALPENSGALFTSDKFSIYSKKYNGNFVFEDLYIIDSRDPNKKVIFLAEIGTVQGNNLILSDGELIEINNETQLKSLIKFSTCSHDLSKLIHSDRKALQSNEKFLNELLFSIDNESISQKARKADRAMLHQKITSPLLAIIFALIAFIATILAPYSRKSSVTRIIIAFASIILIQGLYFWIINSASTNSIFIVINYLFVFALLCVCLYSATRSKLR